MADATASLQPDFGRGRSQVSARFASSVVAASLTLPALAIISIVLMRSHLQDDAFIQLQYARQLLEHHTIQFNDGQSSFGTSSLAYVYTLRFLFAPFSFDDWPGLVKGLSTLFYGTTILLAAILLSRSIIYNQATRVQKCLLWLLSTVVLASPATVRWLTDGMETSLATTAVLLAVVCIQSGLNNPRLSQPLLVLSGIAIALPAVVRVDLVPVTVIAAMVMLGVSGRRSLTTVLTAALIAGVWLLWTMHATGALISDAGVAKQLHAAGRHGFIQASAHAMAAIPILWLAGLVPAALAVRRVNRLSAVLIALSALPIAATFVAGYAEGQIIQGARYFLAPLLFSLAAALVLTGQTQAETANLPFRLSRLKFGALSLLGILSLLQLGVAMPGLARLGKASWNEVNAAAYSDNELTAAHDVGELAWYAPVRVLDIEGLVNGRGVATMTPEQRFCSLVDQMGVPGSLTLAPYQVGRPFTSLGNNLSMTCGNRTYIYRQTDNVGVRLFTKLSVSSSVPYTIFRLNSTSDA